MSRREHDHQEQVAGGGGEEPGPSLLRDPVGERLELFAKRSQERAADDSGQQRGEDERFDDVALAARNLLELVRMTMLCELFDAPQVASATDEVMRTGHVGAEYVEFVLRHKRGLAPSTAPLKLGNAEYDDMSLGEPDLARFDIEAASRLTRDPGIPPPSPTLEQS